MAEQTKKGFKMPTAFTILFLLLIIIAIITHFIPDVRSVTLPDFIMAPINGMIGIRDNDLQSAVAEARNSAGGLPAAIAVLHDAGSNLIDVYNRGTSVGAIQVALFVIFIGGFLGIVAKTGALEAGIGFLVTKLRGGKELLLIPVLMIAFAIGGSTYGMAEETLAFYALITVTMLKAGFDPIVSMATVMIGAYAGNLGGTINPFAVGAAIDAAHAVGTSINQGEVIKIGLVLLVFALAIAITYTVVYARKVLANKSNSILTPDQLEQAEHEFLHSGDQEEVYEFTGKRKLVLALFAFAFIVMMLGVIPWEDFGITIFSNSAWLTGAPLGAWWFPELTIWFLIMAIIIGVVYRMPEKEIVREFMAGAKDMVSVALIIGLSRGISFMMTNSGLDLYILNAASNFLSGMSGPAFAIMTYIIYLPLSFLIPSSSGLAGVSMPIMAPLAENLGIVPSIVVGAFIAAMGTVAYFNPASGILMGALEITKIDYGTWLKWVWRLVLITFVMCIIVLAGAMMFLG